MSRRALIFLVCSVAALAIYSGVFSYWWLHSPVTIRMLGGREVRIVEFHFNAFSWYTWILWQPAFWFIERIGGYEPSGYAAMEEDSAIEYIK